MYSIEDRTAIIDRICSSNEPVPCTVEDLTLWLDKSTMVPHPDTLELIRIASDYFEAHPEIRTVSDIGTGSGLIALSLAKRFPHLRIIATDKSAEALIMANKNANENHITSVEFRQNETGVWLEELHGEHIDAIISNPPFVGLDEFESQLFKITYPEVQKEPYGAIVTTDRAGHDPYFSILSQARPLKPSFFAFHCNSLAIPAIEQEAHHLYPTAEVSSYPDSHGITRFITVHVE